MSPLFFAIDYVSEQAAMKTVERKSRERKTRQMKCHEKKSQKNRMSRIKKVPIPENESVNLHNPYGAPYNTTMLEIVLQCRFFIIVILTF